MPKDFEDDFNEDNSCFECGEVDYAHSKTPGICADCYAEIHTRGIFVDWSADEYMDEFDEIQ